MKNGDINTKNTDIINNETVRANAVEDFKNWIFFSKINQSQPVVNPEENLAVQTNITGGKTGGGGGKTEQIAMVPIFTDSEKKTAIKKYEDLAFKGREKELITIPIYYGNSKPENRQFVKVLDKVTNKYVIKGLDDNNIYDIKTFKDFLNEQKPKTTKSDVSILPNMEQ
jgi:hypothetical protein